MNKSKICPPSRSSASGFNPSLLTGLDMDALSVRAGIKPDALRTPPGGDGGLSPTR